MPAKTSYSVVHRASVTVPDAVWDAFGHTSDYEQFAANVARLVEHSGSDRYSTVIEWGEAPTPRQVQNFARRWEYQIAQWEAALSAKGVQNG